MQQVKYWTTQKYLESNLNKEEAVFIFNELHKYKNRSEINIKFDDYMFNKVKKKSRKLVRK